MYPTLRKGSRVVTQNWFYKLNLKDIIVAKVNNRPVIKRIKRITAKKIFLEGDNKSESTDSREFGEIDKNKLIGKVIFISF